VIFKISNRLAQPFRVDALWRLIPDLGRFRCILWAANSARRFGFRLVDLIQVHYVPSAGSAPGGDRPQANPAPPRLLPIRGLPDANIEARSARLIGSAKARCQQPAVSIDVGPREQYRLRHRFGAELGRRRDVRWRRGNLTLCSRNYGRRSALAPREGVNMQRRYDDFSPRASETNSETLCGNSTISWSPCLKDSRNCSAN